MVENLERIKRQFLWNDDRKKQKFHLVIWSKVCKPKEDGGLGIRLICLFNDALLGKLLWRLGDSSEGLWKESAGIIGCMDMCGGLLMLIGEILVFGREFVMWRRLLVVTFGIECTLGDDIFFWLDKWLGDAPLAQPFRVLFSVASNIEATIRECYYLIHNKVGPQSWRELEDWMVKVGCLE